MVAWDREERGFKAQAAIIAAAFRQNSPQRAFALLRPVLFRRTLEVIQHWLVPLRRFTRRHTDIQNFIARNLPAPPGPPPRKMGNYSAFAERLNDNSVVYSFGVGGDIRFDSALSAAAGCTVHLFDPMPRSARFMELHRDNTRLRFHPWGIWTKDGPQRFYGPPTLLAGDTGRIVLEHRSGSLKPANDAESYFEAACYALSTIMQKLGHERLDLLKMDIEGAAADVLEQILRRGIRPGQIIAEFELPRGHSETTRTLAQLESLFERLKSDGYALHHIKRDERYIDSIEVLAVRA